MHIAQLSSRNLGRSTSPLSAPLSSPKPFASDQRQRTLSSYGRLGTPNSSRPKQKDEWLKAAQESTEHFKTHGSPVPIVWVLTEGNHIPPNAVPFSEDASGPLYIARALIEGHLYLGKAGSQFKGGVFTYAGREITVPKYEILVCASLLRWGFAPLEANGVLHKGTVVLAQQHRLQHSNVHVESFNTNLRPTDILRYVPDERPVDVVKKLTEVKTVVLMDDSISMTDGNLWTQAMVALGGVVDIANRHGPRGVDLHFMHQEGFAENMHSRDDVVRLFGEVQPDGDDTPTGAKLAQLIEHYLPLLETRASTHEPIIVIVITDGAATDYDVLVQSIVDAARRLERSGVKEDTFGIQFVQIGTDVAAAESLRALDFDLEATYKIRDIVAATPFNPGQGVFDTEYMLKILFGSICQETVSTPSYRTQPSMASPRPVFVQSPLRSLTPTLSEKTLVSRMGSPSLTPMTPKRGFTSLIQPPRQGLQHNHPLRSSGSSQYVSSSSQRETVINTLVKIKTVVLVDDSMSMTEGNLWPQAREALGGIVDLANSRGIRGIDLHFMHQEEYFGNMRSRYDIANLFDQVQPLGKDTPTGAKLAELIEHYLPFVESRDSTHEPITIIVITDGEASDYDILVQCIVDTARRLERAGVKEDRFGIQFVQIGTDPAAAQALRALDDDLESTYNVRDIVEFTPFDPDQGVFDTEYMLKILFGSIRRTLSNAPSHQHQYSLSPKMGPVQNVLSGKTSLISTSSIRPRYNIQDHLREPAVKVLSATKTVFLVDESLLVTEGNLLGNLFFEAREAIAGIVELSNSRGLRGVDLHMLHQSEYAENMLSVDDLTNMFAKVQANGTDTPTGTRLAQLLDHYLPLIECQESTHAPVTITVVSGCAPTDPDVLVKCIVAAAQRLDNSGVRSDMFGIQFIQMGTEAATKSTLRLLGDNFATRHNIRDIVATTSFNPAQGTFDSGFMIRLLLGGIWKLFETNQAPHTPSIRVATPTSSVRGLNVSLRNLPRF